VKERDKMIEGITKNIEIKRADEMAETGYLAIPTCFYI
jgi:hypothetical protein